MIVAVLKFIAVWCVASLFVGWFFGAFIREGKGGDE